MFSLTVSQLADLLNVPAIGRRTSADWNMPVKGAAIDSRDVVSGDAFFAIPGSARHGIDFADDALNQGATCVVTDHVAGSTERSDSSQGHCRPTLATSDADPLRIHVPSAIAALQQLAHWNRSQSQALMIGVTGSVGKTTTRQMIASVLQSQFHGIQSPRNFNNELGVPLTLTRLNPDHDFAVLELGAARSGDIRFLTGICHPEFTVVTQIAPAHLESFGSVEAIQATKQELVEATPSDGITFLNADDLAVAQMQRVTSARCVTFGLSPSAAVRGSEVNFFQGLTSFTVDGFRFYFAGGRHLITSALAAIAVARTVGIPNAQIASGLAEFRPDAGRGRIVLQQPWIVVDDSYNASPLSVSAAIQSLAEWTGVPRKYLVLGDMLELGEQAHDMHFEIGRQLAGAGLCHVLTYGQFADVVVSGALSAGLSANRISSFHDLATAQMMLDCLLTPGALVWVKGSRSTRMERIVSHLTSGSQSLRAA
jgi:UDP-N-acetylmuramoyl-tripeptide--D-alanyl-D-alanine ligase